MDSASSGAKATRNFVLRLYVAGEAPNSAVARENLTRLLRTLPPNAVRVEVVDCLREPMRAIDDGVLVTPTLLRISPEPIVTIIGSLGNTALVRSALGIDDRAVLAEAEP